MNITFKLGHHTVVIAARIIADRKGKIYLDKVLPGLTVINDDNFEDLAKGTKVAAALAWMKKQ